MGERREQIGAHHAETARQGRDGLEVEVHGGQGIGPHLLLGLLLLVLLLVLDLHAGALPLLPLRLVRLALATSASIVLV